MSYLVLARKYRPKSFEDLVGQESVAKGLTQAITSGRIGHAFLFVGSRGTGKTSTARILARALNCEKGPTPSPCGKCDSCKGIDEGTDVDVVEIDAASNNSVDNIRELRERIAFSPMRGRFRITILDEVHMLSTGAFNALLKTLEEPPAHAKFIFATTAPEKIPDTIRSRCQYFEFRRIDESAIARRLADICKLENVNVSEPALQAIARAARGGMRDSLSLLDQLVAFSGSNPTEDDLARVMGTAGRELLMSLANAVLEERRGEILTLVGGHVASGGEPMELLSQLADHFRTCLTIALCGPETELVTEVGEVREELISQAKLAGADRLESMVRHLVFARERARFAGPLARASVECALLAASRSGEVNTIPALLERLLAIEKQLSSGAPSTARPANSMNAAPPSAPATAHTAASLLTILAAKSSFGKLLKEYAASAALEGNILKLSLRALDDSKRMVVMDVYNKTSAERLLSEAVPGINLQIELPGSPVAAAAKKTAAPAPGFVASAPPPPAPMGAPTDPKGMSATLSPAAKFVLDATRGRILGHSPPIHKTPNNES